MTNTKVKEVTKADIEKINNNEVTFKIIDNSKSKQRYLLELSPGKDNKVKKNSIILPWSLRKVTNVQKEIKVDISPNVNYYLKVYKTNLKSTPNPIKDMKDPKPDTPYVSDITPIIEMEVNIKKVPETFEINVIN